MKTKKQIKSAEQNNSISICLKYLAEEAKSPILYQAIMLAASIAESKEREGM